MSKAIERMTTLSPSTEKKTVRVDIVSDVVCPWCVIGFKQLERALSLTEFEAQYHWHPFELNPQMPPEGQDLEEHITEKYGTTPDANAETRARLTEMGQALGFTFRYYDEMRIYNTFSAHQLLRASKGGAETALKMALFESYFSNQEDISKLTVLAEVAGKAGLNQADAATLLEDRRFADAVRERERYWTKRGVQAVPVMIFEQRYATAGAQGVETYVELLKQLSTSRAA